jgi:serine/threonine-protein phosphatase 2B catalytic subunit
VSSVFFGEHHLTSVFSIALANTFFNSEESESATELTAQGIPLRATSSTGGDSLGVQTPRVARSIRSFADARKVDMANERLPQFEPTSMPGIFPSPSMRIGGRADLDENVESLIRKTLREESQEGVNEDDLVERVAERLAKGRSLTAPRPSALKRHGTT